LNYTTTKFASPERENPEELNRQIELFKNNDVLNKFLSRVPAVFMVLNKQRQVIYMNEGALEFTGLDNISSVIGKKPGEVVGCIHHNDEVGGCGTSEACINCGAIIAVLKSQKGKPSVEDCRLILGPNEVAYDLRVYSSPLPIDDDEYYAVTLVDIRHEKRRNALEGIFFHDILNTTNGLKSTLDILIDYGERVNTEEYLKKSRLYTNFLIEEIISQRLLNAAETENLKVELRTFNSLELLEGIIDLYRDHKIAKNKSIRIDEGSVSVEIHSDRTIIRRVITNILKNALEATPSNGTVTLGCRLESGKVEFWVHNPGFIPREIQLQIFQRSFSTKSLNRGLGTYSMKLLSNYVEGHVDFLTSEEEGTVFKAIYPKKLENPL